MKVAIIHFRSVRVPGGLESRLINYASYFLRQGYEVTIIHGKEYSDLQLPAQVKFIQVPVKWMPKPLRKLWFHHQCQRIFKKEKFDLTLSLERVAAQILIAPGTHLGFMKAIDRSVYRLTDVVNTYLDRQAFAKSELIMAASTMIKDELAQLYEVPSGKIEVLYPPSDPARFNRKLREKRVCLRQEFGMKDRFSFLFISGSHFRKGLPLLLEIFRHLESYPVHLYIAGSPFRERLPANITHIGFVRKMPELYTAADATIHPSLYEPFGQIISESLMCGTPVIVSGKTGACELVRTGEGIVVNSFEPQQWIEAIKQFMRTEWSVPENFGGRNGLDLEAHMEKMIGYWNSVSESLRRFS